LAYELYCLCGYEHGHDLEHWARPNGGCSRAPKNDQAMRIAWRSLGRKMGALLVVAISLGTWLQHDSCGSSTQ
jgi:hypothetical protein